MRQALRFIARDGSLALTDEIHLGAGNPQDSLAVLESSRADVLLVHSPSNLVRDQASLHRSIAGRPVVFWEADQWGGRKRLPDIYSTWLESAVATFTTGGPPQTLLFKRLGGPEPEPIVSTYDQSTFASLADWSHAYNTRSAIFVGNNLTRAGIGGLPGSRQRWRMVRTLRQRLGRAAVVRGSGWPARWGVSPVAYSSLGLLTRESLVAVAWDHYPETAAATSDRTPVTLLAGRVLVLNDKPAHSNWLPTGEGGVILSKAPTESVEVVQELLEMAPDELLDRGRALHLWARDRLSHSQVIRYMLSRVLPDVQPPTLSPWTEMTDLWR